MLSLVNVFCLVVNEMPLGLTGFNFVIKSIVRDVPGFLHLVHVHLTCFGVNKQQFSGI